MSTKQTNKKVDDIAIMLCLTQAIEEYNQATDNGLTEPEKLGILAHHSNALKTLILGTPKATKPKAKAKTKAAKKAKGKK